MGDDEIDFGDPADWPRFTVTAEEYEQMMEVIRNPPPPTPKLIALMQNYRKNQMQKPETVTVEKVVWDELVASLERYKRLDREAATYVETPITLRTDFTGEGEEVGWKGLGIAMNRALDRRDWYYDTLTEIAFNENMKDLETIRALAASGMDGPKNEG